MPAMHSMVRRYSVRSVLCLVTLACVVMAFIVRQFQLRSSAVQALKHAGALVDHDTSNTCLRYVSATVLRNDGLCPVHVIRFQGMEVSDSQLDCMADIGRVQSIEFVKCTVNLENALLAATCTKSDRLSFHECNLLNQDASCLSGAPYLRKLSFGFSNLRDSALFSVTENDTLSHLSLHGSSVTDDGLMHVRKFENLQHLCLGSDGISIEGLRTFLRSTDLPSVQAFGLEESHEGDWKQLKDAFPHKTISR